MDHNISLWRLRNLAGTRRHHARRALGARIHVARVGTRALVRYWRTQRMRAIQATSPLGTLRLEGPPPIDLSSIFWPD